MSVIRLAWLLVLLGFSCLARATPAIPDPTTSGTAPPPTARRPSGCTTSSRPPVRIARRPSRSSPNSQARNPWLEVKRYSVKDHRGNAQVLLRDGAVARRRGTVGSRLRVLPADHHRLRLGRRRRAAELADALRGLPRPSAPRTPVRPILHRPAAAPAAPRATAALGGRGERRHDGQPAVRRHRGRQGTLAAGAHAGARRHGCVQSLRVLRAAVPAEPAGPRQEPHAHGDRRRHVRAVLGTRLFRVHGRMAQRVPDRRRTARDHDRSQDWSR